MLYRPDDALELLRLHDGSNRFLSTSEESTHCLHCRMLHPGWTRWFRTLTVDCRRTPETQRDARLTHHEHLTVGCAVERVVLHEVQCHELLLIFSSSFLLSAPNIISLDLRGCLAKDVTDSLLLSLAETHACVLQRLYLPRRSGVSQTTLDHFVRLEELDASYHQLTNVDFCSATLRVLLINSCSRINDAGLRNARRLEVLHIASCLSVTDLSPFAESLVELDISFNHSVTSAVISQCRRLQVLLATYNPFIDTLRPFFCLRELSAQGTNSSITDAMLKDAPRLVRLNAMANPHITSVASCGASLRELDAKLSRLNDAGLRTATQLVCLDCSSGIQSVAPFVNTLLELNVEADNEMGSAFLASSSLRVIKLNTSNNQHITGLPPSCAKSLRHLEAAGWSALTNSGLAGVTHLVTLDCTRNSRLTTCKPFARCLQALTLYHIRNEMWDELQANCPNALTSPTKSLDCPGPFSSSRPLPQLSQVCVVFPRSTEGESAERAATSFFAEHGFLQVSKSLWVPERTNFCKI